MVSDLLTPKPKRLRGTPEPKRLVLKRAVEHAQRLQEQLCVEHPKLMEMLEESEMMRKAIGLNDEQVDVFSSVMQALAYAEEGDEVDADQVINCCMEEEDDMEPEPEEAEEEALEEPVGTEEDEEEALEEQVGTEEDE